MGSGTMKNNCWDGLHLSSQIQWHLQGTPMTTEEEEGTAQTVPQDHWQAATCCAHPPRHKRALLPSQQGLTRGTCGKNSKIRATLFDLATMVQTLTQRPTHIKEFIPGDDHYTG
jgi:hypothetical protein